MNTSEQSSEDALRYSRLRLRWTIVATAAELVFLLVLLALAGLFPRRSPSYGQAGETLIWALISVGGIFAYLFWMFPLAYHLDFRLPRAFGVSVGAPADERLLVMGRLAFRAVSAWIITVLVIGSRIMFDEYWPLGFAPTLGIIAVILWLSGREADKSLSPSPEIRDAMDPSLKGLIEELAHEKEADDLALRFVFGPDDGTKMLAAFHRGADGPAIYLSEDMYRRMSRRELRVVLAHELGHMRSRDAIPAMLLSLTPWTAALVVLWVLLPRTVPNGDFLVQAVKSFPLILLTAWLAEFIFRPAQLAFCRRQERRANSSALEAADDPAAFISAMRKVAKGNLTGGQPAWWEKLFFVKDPSLGEVIGQARRYAAEHDIPLEGDDFQSMETDG